MYSRAVAAAFFMLSGCASLPAEPPAGLKPIPAALTAGSWRSASVEPYRGKRDDIVFANATVGYYGTGAGDVFRTDDGGTSWVKIWSKPGTFVRALGFVSPDVGFLGNVGDYYPNVTDKVPLYRTRDGGSSWQPVDFGGAIVPGICAIDVVHARAIFQGELRKMTIVHAAGRVGGPAKLLRSIDGGETWSFIDLSAQAGMILDVKFLDANTGFVFAGTTSEAPKSQALILKTSDGGRSWREVYRSARNFELSWKGSFVDARTGYATVQSYDSKRDQQVVVKTVDGGETWVEMPLVRDAKARQFGIGFATPDIGWVGTAVGGFETRDGGLSWAPVPIGKAANKIRARAADGTPKIVAIGTEVQVMDPPAPR